MLIAATKFGGIAPKIAEHLLPDHIASHSLDVKIESGSLQPMSGLAAVDGVTVDGATKTLWHNPENGVWSDFVYDTDIVHTPLPNDAWDRVYWTDDNPSTPPYMAANGLFSNSYALGLPSPAVSPAVVVNGAAGADPLLAESRAYVVTYLSAYGEESAPSPPSPIVTIYPDEGNTATVTVPTVPSGNFNVTAVNIYRTNTGSTSTEYQLVATVSLGSSYEDSKSSSSLGIVLPSEGWAEPPASMRGIKGHPSGFLCGYTGNRLCCSVSGVPHAWPFENRYAFVGEVVATGMFGASILVLTNRATYIVTGEDPGLLSVEKLEIGGVCLSKRATVDLGYAIIYPTGDGLTVAGVGTAPKVVTEDIVDATTWMSYNPAEMIAAQYGNKYLCVCGSGSPVAGFLFDPVTGSMSPISIVANGLYYDQVAGKAYLHVFGQSTISALDSNPEIPLEYVWRSKNYRLPYPASLGAAQVFAGGYPVTFRVYVDKQATAYYAVAVNNSLPFRLPAGTRYDHVSFEIEATKPVSTVMLASSMAELGGV